MKKILLGLWLLPLAVFAHQSYVVPTYSNGAIVPVLQNELNQGDGGSVSYYQGKLIIHASEKDYRRIQNLLASIDTAQTPITLSVFVGENAYSQTQSTNIGVGIDRRVRVVGDIRHQSYQHNSQSTYQVRGTAGLPMSIGKNTLLQLSGFGTLTTNGVRFRFVNSSWITLTDGFLATATPLPNGQMQVSLAQSQSAQNLATTLSVRQGEWVKVGEISRSSYGNTGQSSLLMPIWLKVE